MLFIIIIIICRYRLSDLYIICICIKLFTNTKTNKKTENTKHIHIYIYIYDICICSSSWGPHISTSSFCCCCCVFLLLRFFGWGEYGVLGDGVILWLLIQTVFWIDAKQHKFRRKTLGRSIELALSQYGYGHEVQRMHSEDRVSSPATIPIWW